MSYYKHHVFFCTNQRDDGRSSCGDHNPQALRDYAKEQIKKLKLSGPGKCRINNAGCMDRCNKGPVLVVYPEAVWYTFKNQADIDEIIQEHLIGGRVVERLKI
ncbi:(2Fe-2S) ferredoxin domain-containing protein [Candidatus Methylomicrobium oryzae]|jgi:(2Fe-2S) ferredoxin|uniref:(2Fe-2S) ferredoxin domain-containing protein n=1 Tax=Candidatus Methylomicrobium oryzae TaxID=2802053 RepID=UPI00192497C9|nr:(2Fe-2S) ferredoxin domain-containing protein [Methylomicrobium sp. RS1]MBL1262781.1 (2Fe-2S) ferredoxin domain-containing protein [Methylomicrobium sp. RS1]